MQRLRFIVLSILVILSAALASAQRPMTAGQVIQFVQSQIELKGDDRATADFLHKIKLTEHLDDRTIEELQGKGAGRQTIVALRKLSQDSAGLPEPPARLIIATPPPKPPPNEAEQQEILAAIREYALNYVKNLPNYVTIQTTRRGIDPTQPGYRAMGDVVQEQLTFFEGKESYVVQAINGRSSSNVNHNQLGGVVTSGEFGTILQQIFDPASGTDFRWDHWGKLRGDEMYVFAYHVPEDHGYSMYDGETKQHYTSAYKGLVYAEIKSKTVMQIQMDTIGVPADFPVREVHLKLDYKSIPIAGESFVLPYHFELDSHTTKADTKNEADYKMYRRFGSESSISFGDTDPIPQDQLNEQPAAPPGSKPSK